MRIAIHQPLFIPWFPFFEKMALVDEFVILEHAQYTNNNNLNRQNMGGKWWTKPVKHGLAPICDKEYADGFDLVATNMAWIKAIAFTLGIDYATKIRRDFKTDKRGTERIIEICEHRRANEYLAAADAPEKYLDVTLLEAAGIKFIPFESKYRQHVFDLFNVIGIEKTAEILRRHERGREENA